MAVNLNAQLDCNDINARSESLLLTVETEITLYVTHNVGADNHHEVTIEISPDGGSTWVPVLGCIVGIGYMTVTAVATAARIAVCKTEGVSSVVTAHLLAR